MQKNAKKCKKMKKNCKKICIYQKFVVILHRQMKKTPISNQIKNKKLCTQSNKQNSRTEYLTLYKSCLLDLNQSYKQKTKFSGCNSIIAASAKIFATR